jgi:large subunit ribosomal protein L17
MRHRKAGSQLGRNASHRRAMLRNMVASLLRHEQVVTTQAKAKAVRPVAEKMITLAKRGGLHARRQAFAYINDKEVTHRLFEGIKDRYLDRQGGYVRIVKKGVRKGDGAPLSVVQLISPEEGKKKSKKKTKKAKGPGKGPEKKAKDAASRKEKVKSAKESKKTGQDEAPSLDKEGKNKKIRVKGQTDSEGKEPLERP